MQLLTSQKKILGPVYLHPKTNKCDYLGSPIMKKIFVSCFDIGEVELELALFSAFHFHFRTG